MEISYDDIADAMYIKLRDGKFMKNKEVSEGIILDIGKGGTLLGIEILEVSSRLPAKELTHIDVKFPVHLAKAKGEFIELK